MVLLLSLPLYSLKVARMVELVEEVQLHSSLLSLI